MRNDRITFRVLSVGLTTFVEIEKINRALVFTVTCRPYLYRPNIKITACCSVGRVFNDYEMSRNSGP